jgi:AraC-like DNA-binding protein
MNQTVLGFIYLIACSHALMLTVVLWKRSSSQSPARILSIITALISYKLFESGALFSGMYEYVSHLMDLVPFVVLFIGPLYFAYTLAMTRQKRLKWYQWLMHLMPAVIFWMRNAPSILQDASTKVDNWNAVLNRPPNLLVSTEWVVILLAIKVHLGCYLFASWRAISASQRVVNNVRADHSDSTLKSMKITVTALFGLEFVWVSLFVAQQFGGIGTLAMVSNIWLLFVALLVLAIAFTGLQHPNLVFTEEERKIVAQVQIKPHDNADGSASTSNVKYLHSSIPESTGNIIAKELEEQFKQNQWYLDEKLTLTELARLTEIKAHTLSQVINQTMKSNFYKMINTYRVEHAVELINASNTNWPLERIAYESGFANRVTFSKAFKEIMACTPSAYKKSQTKVKVTKTS